MTTTIIENGQEYQVEIDSRGTKYWYQNDKLHRLDGPACEYANGDKYWYIKGTEYSKEKFEALLKQEQEELEYRMRPLPSRFSRILGNK
jgi:hypothetical protein